MYRLEDFDYIEMYESQKYYNDLFNAIDEHIRIHRDQRHYSKRNTFGRGEALFHLSDDDYYSLESLTSIERNAIIHAVGIIIRELMKRNQVTVFSPECHVDRIGQHHRYLSLSYEKQEGIKTGVKVIWDFKQLHGLDNYLIRLNDLSIKNEVDEVEVIVLEKKYHTAPNSDYHEFNLMGLNELENYNKLVQEKDPGFVKFISIDDFFIQHFGAEEYSIFEAAVNAFNIRNRDLIGYKTIFMPNEIEVEKFINGRVKDLEKFDYKKEMITAIKQLNANRKLSFNTTNILLNNIDSLYEKCSNHYFMDLRYLILTGEEDLSESFISSEWYYYSSFNTDILDKTAIAVGYLKSSEQLIYQLLRLHINDANYNIQLGKKIKSNEIKNNLKNTAGYPKSVPFLDIYEEYFDTTFGSLNTFVRHYQNNGLFEPEFESEWKTFVVNYLFDYCKEDRNEHLHKDNIYSATEIGTIRNRTLLLYFCLLGSFCIDRAGLRKLGGKRAFFKADIYGDLFQDFSDWMESKIEDCKSNSSTVVLSACYDLRNGGEIIQFYETTDFDANNFFKLIEEIDYSVDSFSYDLGKYINERERGIILSNIVKAFLSIRKQLYDENDYHKIILLSYGQGYIEIQ